MSLPLHERIRSEIEARILSGDLAPGDRIPTEHELMLAWGCARMTVSKALTALAAAGLVERRRRSGTVVARPRVHSMIIDVPDLPSEVCARGQTYCFLLLERRVRSAARGNADERALAGTGKLLDVTGLHLADGTPLAVEHRLVSLAAVPPIAAADLAAEPPGSWLLRHVPWTEAETRVTAIGAGEHASRLGVEEGTPCLAIDRRTWRGADAITLVRQVFLGSGYDLSARFGQEAAALRAG